jgi:hypothetical protein
MNKVVSCQDRLIGRGGIPVHFRPERDCQLGHQAKVAGSTANVIIDTVKSQRPG